MTPIPIQNNADQIADAIKNITVAVHYTCGFTPETMKTANVCHYSGDLLEISLHAWSDLRRFNDKMFSWDKDLVTGMRLEVPGMLAHDPRLIAIRDRILEYVQALNRKNNAQWS